MKLELEIREDIKRINQEKRIIERYFCAAPIMAFQQNPIAQINIFEEVKLFFDIPFSAIRVAGSARLGFSAHKGRDFIPGKSDLDIAIVSHEYFSKILNEASRVTRGFRDLSTFEKTENISNSQHFKDYLAKGIIMTKFMPSCKLRADIDSFFAKLQKENSALFRTISAAIYLDENFFIQKQKSFIKSIANKGI